MPSIPTSVLAAWQQREDNCVLTSISSDGTPNSVWILCVDIIDEDTLLMADNFMVKTQINSLAECYGSLLMLAPERVSYQFKGRLAYHHDDPMHELALQKWPPPKFPVKGAVTLSVDKIYAGAEEVALV